MGLFWEVGRNTPSHCFPAVHLPATLSISPDETTIQPSADGTVTVMGGRHHFQPEERNGRGGSAEHCGVFLG
jgi:hypothetical protein